MLFTIFLYSSNVYDSTLGIPTDIRCQNLTYEGLSYWFLSWFIPQCYFKGLNIWVYRAFVRPEPMGRASLALAGQRKRRRQFVEVALDGADVNIKFRVYVAQFFPICETLSVFGWRGMSCNNARYRSDVSVALRIEIQSVHHLAGRQKLNQRHQRLGVALAVCAQVGGQ